jgi:hypothetical protein
MHVAAIGDDVIEYAALLASAVLGGSTLGMQVPQPRTQANTMLSFFKKPPEKTKLPNMSENNGIEPGPALATMSNNVDPTFDNENLSPSKGQQTIDLTLDDDYDNSTSKKKAAPVSPVTGPSLELIFDDDVQVVEID